MQSGRCEACQDHPVQRLSIEALILQRWFEPSNKFEANSSSRLKQTNQRFKQIQSDLSDFSFQPELEFKARYSKRLRPGFVTLHGDEVVSWSLADCVSGNCCEIGIHTATSYRRLGLATVTAAVAVDYALSHGFSQVGWHCDEDNLGSSGTAEKVGFTRERNYKMYYMFLDEAIHLVEMARHRSWL